ncbi:glycogen/starch synthase [Carboxylicivirga linearis]|uniref:starch synthase n=1 Tax=Carboxylicivirga linearis TaxID=1628157 RepID=A0ABS5JTM6_9BACT|nr:glycogen/starch synthase [Carboxylicivirga linearis]MBS2098212.1 glycogen/starch synthase [Carboxylicivirga linearis]
MEKAKVLFISQEITPYLPESEMSKIGRYLPQGIQELGKEIRTFMPRFGCINERRNQLHEVIRLSGMNLIIDDTDHPLIIKVASIQAARMQVYFIDNEDYFQRKATLTDKNGEEFEDNDERTIFFARGALETTKKLRWAPDIVHCNGWFTALAPLYIKKAMNEDPHFANSKVVYTIYDDEFKSNWADNFKEKLKIEGVEDADLEVLEKSDYIHLSKLAIAMSDGVIQGSENINPELVDFIKQTGKPFLGYHDEESYTEAYNGFYDSLLD